MRTSLIAVVLGSFGVAATSFEALQQGGKQSPEPAVGVSRASHVVAIAAEQAGTIVDLPVTEGELVEEGRVVFRLSSRLQQLRVDRLITITKSDLSVQRALAALEHSNRLTQRLERLSQKDIASDAEVQDRALDAMLARLKYEQSKIDHELIKNDLEQAKVLLDQRTVRTPISGVVTELFKHRGDTTEKLVPVLEVARLDPLWVEFECPVKDKAGYALGTKVELRPAARPDEVREGTVVHVAMRANPSSHTFRVRVATPNKGHTWKAGLKMRITSLGPPQVEAQPIPAPK